MPAKLEVLNPAAITQGEVDQFNLAARPRSLDGKRIGLLWNGKRGGDTALAKAGELLQARFKNIKLVTIVGSIGLKAEVIERAKKECDIAIGSTGD